MNRNATVISCFIACLASVGVASGTAAPVAYGAGEVTPAVGITGIVSTLAALLSGGGGLFALLKKGNPQEIIRTVADIAQPFIGGTTLKPIGGIIKDATDLLPLIAKNEIGVEMSAVRVAIFTLEIHCSICKPDKLRQVHALAKELLVASPVEPEE